MVSVDEQALARYRAARKIVERGRAVQIFLSHLTAYIVGNVFLGVWNTLTYYIKEDETLWFYIPLLFWGVGIIIHYLQAIALFDNWWDNDEAKIVENLPPSSYTGP